MNRYDWRNSSGLFALGNVIKLTCIRFPMPVIQGCVRILEVFAHIGEIT